MEEFYAQLWIKQIPNFIIAYHDGFGTFPTADIHVENVEHKLQAWERQNKLAVHRLILLLNKIIHISMTHREDLLEVYCPSVDYLEIRKQYGKGVGVLKCGITCQTILSTFSQADGIAELNLPYV